MQPKGARLIIDYGAATTVAMLALPAARLMPVMLDGAPTVPSGVFVDPDDGDLTAGGQAQQRAMDRPDCYLPDPKQHLTAGKVPVGGRDVDALDLIAATLRLVADEARRIAGGPAGEVALTLPTSWGSRRRHLLSQAVARAGLPEPHLVADPVAAAAGVHPDAPATGVAVLVCDAGAACLQVSVVAQQPDGWTVLASIPVPNAGGRDIDDLLVAHAVNNLAVVDPQTAQRLREPVTLDDLRARYALREAARQAKHALWRSPSALIALPDPHPPAVIDQAQLATLTAPTLKRMTSTIDDVTDAPGVVADHLTTVVLTGGGARLPGLAETIAAHTGRTPVVPQRPEQALADGVSRVVPDIAAGDRSASAREMPRVRLGLRQVLAPAVLAAASLAVLIQTLTTATVYQQGPPSLVIANTAGFSVAALCAMLAAIAAAHMMTQGGLVIDMAGPGSPSTVWAPRLVAKSYAGAAAIGIIVAAIYGLLSGAYLGLADNPYLRASLLGAVPIAIPAVAAALLAARLPPGALSRWLRQVRQPVTPVLLAAGGVLAMRAAVTVSPSTVPLLNLIGRAGAAAIGVAIALTITRDRGLRALVGTILAGGAAAVFTLANITLIEAAYVVAVSWWWLVQFVGTARLAAPHLVPTVRRWLR